MHKKTVLLFVFLACVISCGHSLLAREAFVIDEYRVDVTIGENNIYLVTEDLSVTFSERRHGLFRDIPARYTQPSTKKTRKILVENIQVRNHPFKVTKSRSNVNIRIGSPEVWVNGPQRYRISYTLNVGNDNISDYDEFYMNLIGNEWDTSIKQTSFQVTFPKSFDVTKYNFTGGLRGSIDNSFFSHEAEGKIIRGATTRMLQPHEGVTLRVELPDGYFVGAREIKDTFYSKMYLFLLLALSGSAFLWHRYGRDSLVVTPVEFTPPEGMTPAETGYVIDGYADNKDITSLLIHWASRGYMDIEELDRKNFRFIKKMPLPPESKSFEKSLFSDLFNNRDQVDTSELKYKFAESLSFAKKDVTEYFRSEPDRRIFTPKSRWARSFISLLVLATAGLTAWKLASEVGGDTAPRLILAGVAGVTITILAGLIQMLLDKWATLKRGFRILLLILAVLPIAAVAAVALVLSRDISQLPGLVLAGTAAIAILTFLSFIARKRTERGTDLLGKILGLKDFINRAELDRIRMLVDENPQYFYSILPYAYSLGLSEKWAENFNDIVTPPPSWYSGGSDRGVPFTPVLFTHNLNHAMRMTEASMSAVKGSSGGGSMGGGGGFSGGGVGGGGGGSW